VYYTGIGVENLMKTSQRHNRSQQIASGYLSNTSHSSLEPTSSIFQFHHTARVSWNISVNNDRLPASWPRFLSASKEYFPSPFRPVSLFFSQVCGRIEVDKASRRGLIICRSDNRSNYVSPGQTQVLFCIVWWMTHRAPSFARRKSRETGRVSVRFWR
jgi:hypothetical protein